VVCLGIALVTGTVSIPRMLQGMAIPLTGATQRLCSNRRP
jgi:hypothetical protein